MNGQRFKKTCRGFTLIEAVVMVLVLAIAVPPTLEVLMNNSASRVNIINTARATMLASNVLEGIVADVSSSDGSLGFDALADSDLYLNASPGGFYDRMAPATGSYGDLGLQYTVEIGVLVGSDGQVSGEASENIFRTVTVRVEYLSSDGAGYDLPVSIMVSSI